MFNWVRSLFSKKSAVSVQATVPKEQFDALNDRFRHVQAKYDAAQTNEDNRRHWANADGLSAAAANRADIRRVLRNRSRYEYDNGSYCNGIVRTRADDLVGTGPTLQILTEDDALNEQIEQAFATWARASCFAEKLHTMDQTRCRDGEAFALFVTNPRLNHAVKFDLLLIEADLIADPTGTEIPTANRLDGIEYDDLGQPVAYHVLSEHPGDAFRGLVGGSARVDAEQMLHWYRKDRPGQLRGVPELTSSLPLFPYQRRLTLATLAAAESAASFAVVLESDNAPIDENPVVAAPFQGIEIERGMYTEMPGGYHAKQIAAEHPNQTYEGFKRETCNEMGRPVRMPSNVVSADSSKHNFSSAKLDHFGYRGALGVDRHFCSINQLDKVFAAFVREAVQISGVLPAGVDVMALPRGWYWPGWPSMDKDQSGQDNERLENGTLTLADYWAEQGQDWKAKIRQRGKELKFMAAEGVPTAAEKAAPKPVMGPKKMPEEMPNDEQGATKTEAASRLNGYGHRNGNSSVLLS